MNQPFNLAAFKAGDVALSSVGEEFRFVGHMPDGSGDIAVVGENGSPTRLSPNGNALRNNNVYLVSMKIKTKVVWLNLYPTHNAEKYACNWHDNEGDAKDFRDADALNAEPTRIEIRV